MRLASHRIPLCLIAAIGISCGPSTAEQQAQAKEAQLQAEVDRANADFEQAKRDLLQAQQQAQRAGADLVEALDQVATIVPTKVDVHRPLPEDATAPEPSTAGRSTESTSSEATVLSDERGFEDTHTPP